MAARFLGLSIHFGSPALPTKLRRYRGTILSKSGLISGNCHSYADHQLRKWYGISFGLSWAFGVCVFGESSEVREFGARPYCDGEDS